MQSPTHLHFIAFYRWAAVFHYFWTTVNPLFLTPPSLPFPCPTYHLHTGPSTGYQPNSSHILLAHYCSCGWPAHVSHDVEAKL
jgi:hypothetical protein